MELPLLLSLPCLVITSLLIMLFSFHFLEKKVTRSKFKLPPGPWTLPFIGNLHQLATTRLPHHVLYDLAKLYGPVMLLRAGETNLLVLTSREAAKEVMKTQDSNFANRPETSAAKVLMYGCTDIAFSNGPYWRQLRRICITELLISKRIKYFSSIRQEEINSMLKSFNIVSDKLPVNLSAKAIELSNNIVLRAAFGGLCKNRGLFLEIIGEVMEVFSGFNLSDLFPSLGWLDFNTRRRLTRLHSKMDSVLEGVVQEHLKKHHQQKKQGDKEIEYDLADVLIHVKKSNDLDISITMDNIKAAIMDIFIGGTETSSTTIAWAMTELIRNPTVMEKAHAEIRQGASENTAQFDENALGYLKLVIKETLRLHPPAPLLLPRICKESCQVLGYTVPSGTRVAVNAWALGRNPDYWNNPEEFNPERFRASTIDYKGQHYEFVPFGAGRRICPGIEFGVAVVEETLARLLLHFDWKLPDGMKTEDMDMTETFGLVAAKKVPLCLIPILRVPLPDV